MTHQRGINLVRNDGNSHVGKGASGPLGSSDNNYRVEVWTSSPEASGTLLETISRATDFAVSIAAYKAALLARPGTTLLHLNGRHRMSCEVAPEPTHPEPGRPSQEWVRPGRDEATLLWDRLSSGLC